MYLEEHRFIDESRLETRLARHKTYSVVLGSNELTPLWGSVKKYSRYSPDPGDSCASSFCSAQEIILRQRGIEFIPSRAFFAHKEALVEEYTSLSNDVIDGEGYVKKYGIVSDQDWDAGSETNVQTIDNYFHLFLDSRLVANIEGALNQQHPVLATFRVYDSFEDSEDNGMVPMPDNDEYIGCYRAVVVGYSRDKQLFTVLIALEEWGHEGYVYIPYAYFADEKLGLEFTVVI